MFRFLFPPQYLPLSSILHLTCSCGRKYPSEMLMRYSIEDSFFYHEETEYVCITCGKRKRLRIIRTWLGKEYLEITNLPPFLERPPNIPSIHFHIKNKFH